MNGMSVRRTCGIVRWLKLLRGYRVSLHQFGIAYRCNNLSLVRRIKCPSWHSVGAIFRFMLTIDICFEIMVDLADLLSMVLTKRRSTTLEPNKTYAMSMAAVD